MNNAINQLEKSIILSTTFIEGNNRIIENLEKEISDAKGRIEKQTQAIIDYREALKNLTCDQNR